MILRRLKQNRNVLTKGKGPKGVQGGSPGQVQKFGLRRDLGELRTRRQVSEFLGMPGAFQMGLEPGSRCSSMFAGFAPMFLPGDSELRTATALWGFNNSSSLSDVDMEVLMSQKPRIGAECEVADSEFMSLVFQGFLFGLLRSRSMDSWT